MLGRDTYACASSSVSEIEIVRGKSGGGGRGGKKR